jgi:bifunctional non-homologous end joining protein LigD
LKGSARQRAKPVALPTIVPMQAEAIDRPFHRDGWIYEEKYDGWRVVAYKDGTAIRLVSRAGKDHSRRFSELAAAIRELPPATLILDGEVAIFDEKLISRFEWFRKRPEDVASTPPIYMAFDCLYLESHDLRPLTLRERRTELETAVENDHTLIFPARRLAANGLEAWAQAVAAGYEGMVAKDDASPYKGGRTLSWLKVKQPNYREGERGWEPTGKIVALTIAR